MTNPLKKEREGQGSVDQIILGIAHELNNPNTFVRMNTQNLKRMFNLLRPCLDEYEKEHPEARFGPYSLPELRARFNQHLESTLQATIRIIAVADKLKQCTFDSLENNSAVSLLEIVMDMLHSHDFLMAGSLSVNLSFDEGKAFMVVGHRLQLEQAVSTLLTNARDAILERHGEEGEMGGRLDISLKEEDQRVILHVSDNGSGMSRETLEKVFDPYFTTKPQGVGDGLGLQICRSIISRHGGSVHIESEEGRGTDVSIELPKGKDD
jgi:two-component system, NtrC family, sensor kinase